MTPKNARYFPTRPSAWNRGIGTLGKQVTQGPQGYGQFRLPLHHVLVTVVTHTHTHTTHTYTHTGFNRLTQ